MAIFFSSILLLVGLSSQGSLALTQDDEQEFTRLYIQTRAEVARTSATPPDLNLVDKIIGRSQELLKHSGLSEKQKNQLLEQISGLQMLKMKMKNHDLPPPKGTISTNRCLNGTFGSDTPWIPTTGLIEHSPISAAEYIDPKTNTGYEIKVKMDELTRFLIERDIHLGIFCQKSKIGSDEVEIWFSTQGIRNVVPKNSAPWDCQESSLQTQINFQFGPYPGSIKDVAKKRVQWSVKYFLENVDSRSNRENGLGAKYFLSNCHDYLEPEQRVILNRLARSYKGANICGDGDIGEGGKCIPSDKSTSSPPGSRI